NDKSGGTASTYFSATQAPAIAGSIRRHEDRQTESGEMVQRLVDADQPPEPLMLHRHVESRDAKTLGAIDGDVDREIDKGDEPESRRDDQDEQKRNRKMYQAMHQERQRPALLLILALGHPGILQQEVRNDVLDGQKQHPADQQTNRNRRRHRGKQQS